MGYFPFFQNIEGAQIVVVGGGKVAYGKVEKLLPYEPAITVVAPVISDAIKALHKQHFQLHWIEKCFDFSDLAEAAVVIAATDDAALNHDISVFCREKKIPVNVVDCAEDCTFLFPALIKQGKLSIGISTGGASPKTAAYLKDQIKAVLPEDIEGKLELLHSIRPLVKERFAEEKARAAFYQEILAAVMCGELTTIDQVRELLDNR